MEKAENKPEKKAKKHKMSFRAFKIGLLIAASSLALSLPSGRVLESQPIDSNKTKTEKFIENANSINEPGIKTGPIRYKGADSSKAKLIDMVRVLKESEYGKKVLECADSTGLALMLDDRMVGVYGCYFSSSHLVILNPTYDTKKLMTTMPHELTHAKQEVTGSGILSGLTPEEYIILYRAKEADACAGSIQAAWEMKQNGYSDAWNGIMNNSGYEDIAKAYEKEAIKDSSSVKNGMAMRAAFDQWFSEPWRLKYYDKKAIEAAFIYTKEPGSCASFFSGEKSLMDRLSIMGEVNDSTNYLVTGTDRDTLTANHYKGNMSKENEQLFDSLESYVGQKISLKKILDAKAKFLEQKTTDNNHNNQNLFGPLPNSVSVVGDKRGKKVKKPKNRLMTQGKTSGKKGGNQFGSSAFARSKIGNRR